MGIEELKLCSSAEPPKFSFYDAAKPMYTSRRNLPPSKIDNSKVKHLTFN
ncbi:glucose-1-phosphate adenylyltransferase large subunit 3, chloroplastic/amyloplastic [Sesbania bispinosa]|nr:glucose-1-phosphate adenylyltransferase large subunit 3, chloroplastic/amyloplastic [Sesbania bispinosa]